MTPPDRGASLLSAVNLTITLADPLVQRLGPSQARIGVDGVTHRLY
jgi:hypothetical protein